MEQNIPANSDVIGTFTIPEEIAKELSHLLVKQSVQERMLLSLIGKPEYDRVESNLIDIINKIDVLKNKITVEYVPEQFRSEKYVWNYDGYSISGNTLTIHYA